MRINAPTLGPIVGYTTNDQTRIWLRGDFQQTSDGYRRCFGVARLRELGTNDYGEPQFVKLAPHFDVTGVCAFTSLKEDTLYDYQAGWFFAETELENLDSSQLLDWTLGVNGRFKTGSADSTKPRTYALGSCRYLLRLFGGSIFDERGDKIFSAIHSQHVASKSTPLDGLLMVGDQIYADDLRFIGSDSTIDAYLARYRSVFGQPNLRKLMSCVPTYMILDDHEIEDNWPIRASDQDWLTKYPAAIHAYQIYQCSHSPVFDLDESARIAGTLDKLWYTFSDGCCDFFFVDCRTERMPSLNRMISEAQLSALLNWLTTKSGRVKVIVTSVPFFPDLRTDTADKWSGFLEQRKTILDHILSERIRNVIFISGDVHCSFSSELVSDKDPNFKIISVVSSSFFWPYPHLSESDFILSGQLKVPGKVKYKVKNTSDVYSVDNFTRLTLSPSSVEINPFGRKGEPLGAAVTRSF